MMTTVQVKEKIDLTEIERKIFDRLLGTLRYCNLNTQLRVAGGWVRDKLLGKESNDIDIAIDNMLGSAFLDKVKEYLSSIDEQVQGVIIIEKKPDQSKHLETARMRLYDQWIDFVNLRSEEYTETSRIPTVMKFGTAEEDAYRRDLTINSLFYNINTGLVEDLTKRGIEDLKSGKIVTPLPAKVTFLDDPLRVLRAIRFSARFGFTLDEELKEAASSEEVKLALGGKISRERIGTEIDAMISGNGPVSAVTCLCDLKLFSVVFSLEPTPSKGRLCKACLDAMWCLIQTLGISKFSDEERRLPLYAALFLPFRKADYKDEKGKLVPVVNQIFKLSMKRKTIDAGKVLNIHCTAERLIPLIPPLQSKNDVIQLDSDTDVLDPEVPAASRLRVTTGFILREIKDLWRVALLMSLLLCTFDGMNEDQETGQVDFKLDKTHELYLTVEETICEMGLDKIWDVKPLVNGREIMQIANLTGGSIIRKWQQKVLTWQLAYPSGSADKCKDWMRETKGKKTKNRVNLECTICSSLCFVIFKSNEVT